MLTNIAAALALSGFAVAGNYVTSSLGPECTPVTLCIDGYDDCGQMLQCVRTGEEPDSSPCNPTTVTTTTPPTDYPTSQPTSDCASITVCADYINDCGMMYGGCFPDCRPWPTFTAPPCPTGSSTLQTRTSTNTDHPECSDGAPRTKCVDKVNDCGKKYGGCFDYCATPTPSFSTPPCPSTKKPTKPVPTRTRKTRHTSQTRTSYPDPDPSDDPCADNGELFLCVDGIDECGNGWGDPSYVIPTPSCSITPSPTVVDPEPSCADITVCADYVNECGIAYGGTHKPSPTPTSGGGGGGVCGKPKPRN
ncbi:unnamed protein product [Parascedosporium putredinis]|uniref:Uncharacterized protein n=1 Tax=Parascedosporium putredinis TaxID=1442378 RepID=A0A9P1H5F4_9PEZI|nr:unnamed protein product [Parascedosporium putredinis]CAI7997875.1 unnamed protein product [Parascedosporium putredinis]